MNIVVCIDYTILKREEEIEVEVEKLVFGFVTSSSLLYSGARLESSVCNMACLAPVSVQGL